MIDPAAELPPQILSDFPLTFRVVIAVSCIHRVSDVQIGYSSVRHWPVKANIYKMLLADQSRFKEVIDGLGALRQDPAFPPHELDRYAALAKETRAVTGSYLAGWRNAFCCRAVER